MDRENVDSIPDYFYKMSHELRNALNVMMASCTMASRHINDSEKVMDYLDRIYKTGNRITSIIDNILDFRRMYQKELKLNNRPFSIEMLENELKTIIEPLAVGKNLNFSISSERFFSKNLLGDYDRLFQVLVNLAANSIKYTEPGGNVVLCFEEIENSNVETVKCRFVCSDDGIGMSDDFLEHIFEPFSRAEDERVRDIKGSGLGMAIVKETVTAMNGDIHIVSMLDAGTTVTIQLELGKNMRKG